MAPWQQCGPGWINGFWGVIFFGSLLTSTDYMVGASLLLCVRECVCVCVRECVCVCVFHAWCSILISVHGVMHLYGN